MEGTFAERNPVIIRAGASLGTLREILEKKP
jgi:hypothetical protein